MVNLVVTTHCNSNCPFCFAKDIYGGAQKYMQVSDVLRLMRFVSGDSISILGGEPTQHPQFLDIMEIIYKSTKNVFLLTNGLGDLKIYKKITERWHTPLLINIQSAEYRGAPAAREQLLSLLEYFRGRKVDLNISYTINGSNSHDNLKRIIEKDQGRSIRYIRLSAMVPSVSNKSCLIKSAVGDEYLKIIAMVKAIAPKIGFLNECYLDGCMFTPESYAQLSPVIRAMGKNQLVFEPCTLYTKAPIEIFPDMSATYCYPLYSLKELSVSNVFDYKNIQELRQDLQVKYNLLHGSLSGACAACVDKKQAWQCPGVCLVDKVYNSQ